MNSEQTNEIAAALAKAQGQMESAKFNKTNPHFKSRYADLSAIIEAIKKPLADNGISYTQTTFANQDADLPRSTFVLITTLMHSSGQWISSEYPLPYAPDKPQLMGSALTYARRYELAALCGIAAEEDDDGNAAEGNSSRKPPKPAPDVIQAPPYAARPHGPHDPATGEIEDDQPSPGIPIKDMAREAAQRGRAVMKAFYEARSKAEKMQMKEIWPELEDLMDAADAANQEEGS